MNRTPSQSGNVSDLHSSLLRQCLELLETQPESELPTSTLVQILLANQKDMIANEAAKIQADKEVALEKIKADKEVALKKIEADKEVAQIEADKELALKKIEADKEVELKNIEVAAKERKEMRLEQKEESAENQANLLKAMKLGMSAGNKPRRFEDPSHLMNRNPDSPLQASALAAAPPASAMAHVWQLGNTGTAALPPPDSPAPHAADQPTAPLLDISEPERKRPREYSG